MDVVPDTSPVRSRKIGPVNLGVWRAIQRDLQDPRNQVCFYPVVLAESVGSACDVEVAKDNKGKTVNLIKPAENLLKHQFGLPVWVNRVLWRAFIDRNPVGRPESRAGRREHYAVHSVFNHRMEKIQAAVHVVLKILVRI